MNLLILSVVLAAPPQAPVPPQGPPVDEARVRQIAREEVERYLAGRPTPAAGAQGHYTATYGTFEREIAAGRRGVLFVGVPEDRTLTGLVGYTDAVPGRSAGVYDCWLDGTGQPVMLRRGPAFATPVRSAVSQFLTPRTTCSNGTCTTTYTR